ncbi:AsmA-like C-terminal region-containing protein [Algoriphagus mannitolivorans]|uniref:AsmA-like C-terminal region-containing protein n=1 Tax=Algoriphagus mannitolivorans TaxID=226504 RepID=UPI00041002EA|nr:AsmA-like C-terminal region-containing protein [Algoriphagus mannitolivorans]
MKRTLLIGSGIFAFLLILITLLPFLFKDKIIARLDREISNSVNANVIYDLNKISISLWRSFPNVSVTIEDFGIVGNPPFQQDTLLNLKELGIDFNLMSVLFQENPSLTGIELNGGDFFIKVLEDGTANYDIFYPEEEKPEQEEEEILTISVNKISLKDVNLIYEDRSLAYLMVLTNVQGQGKGEFTTEKFELPVDLTAKIAEINYEGISYISNKDFEGKTLLDIDLPKMKFGLTEGDFRLNDFGFGLSGFIAMPEEDIEFDLAFQSKDHDFKSILSLVPGMYSDSFSKLETSGQMDMKGFVKGIYSDTEFPAFELALNISGGMFKYPDLPRPVKNVNMDLVVKNETALLENTSVSIPKFNLDFGSNPISGRFLLANLINYPIDAGLKGKLNLDELTSIFPIDGMDLKGILDINATAKGRYDSLKKEFPAMDILLELRDGYAKNQEYPAPIEKIYAKASIKNQKGTMQDFLVDIPQFGFNLEGEAIQGKINLRDLDKLVWDGEIKGAVDLKKVMAIFPMEGLTLEGKIKTDLSTKGSYAAVESKKYDQLTNQGTLELSGFKYLSEEVPQGVQIEKAKAEFSPERITLSEFDAILGQSPLQATGTLSNYMDYFLNQNGILKGQLSLSSTKFNVNEWMTESSNSSTSASLTVIELPKNIDFTMAVNANEVLYDNLNLKEVKGQLVLREGVLSFSDASMKTLGGTIGLNGNYDPRDLVAPKFNFNLQVIDLSIAEAFSKFNTIKAFAPIAENLTGKFNTNLRFSGNLGQDMMPILSTMNAIGLLQVAQTALKDSKILQGITTLTKLQDTNSIELKNLAIPVTIENGVMDVKPFNLKLWDYQTQIQGSAGFDGSMNYLIQLEVPARKFGAQATSLLSKITDNTVDQNTPIPLAFNLSGTYKSPKVSLAGGNSIETILADALKSRVQGETKALQDEAKERFAAAQDSLKQELKAKATVVQDSLKKEVVKQSNVVKEKAAGEAKKLLKGILPKAPAKPDTTIIKDNN